MLTFTDCQTIERQHGSPFYLFDRERLAENYRRFERAFCSRYEPVVVAYSYKTNYLPSVCRLVKELGGHAEVVSRLEYELALRVGEAPARGICNGPVKGRDDLEVALGNGSLVNLDSAYELEHVRSFAARHPGRPARVGLRVNMDLGDEAGASHVQEGLQVGRFGFAPEALPQIARALSECGLRVRALHGHSSSSSRSTWIYRRIAATLCRLAEEHLPDAIEQINVGGGFFGAMPPELAPPGAPSFDEYAEAIAEALAESPWARRRRPCLVLEPGVALVADCLSFVTRIVDVKEVRGRTLAVVDGSALHVKPSLHRKNQPHRVIREEGSPELPARVMSVTGATCMEKDYLLSDVRCGVGRGDYLQIGNAGAYSIVMAPPFIHAAPAVVAREGEQFLPLRRRQPFEHFFENYAV